MYLQSTFLSRASVWPTFFFFKEPTFYFREEDSFGQKPLRFPSTKALKNFDFSISARKFGSASDPGMQHYTLAN